MDGVVEMPSGNFAARVRILGEKTCTYYSGPYQRKSDAEAAFDAYLQRHKSSKRKLPSAHAGKKTAPSLPRDAFSFYAIDRWPKLKAENAGLEDIELGEILASTWAKLSEQEKAPFLDQAECVRVIEKEGKKKPKKRKKDPRRPKNPRSAYACFTAGAWQATKESLPDGTPFADIGRTVTQRWNTMSKSDKEPYFIMADEEKTRYEKELEIYNRIDSSLPSFSVPQLIKPAAGQESEIHAHI